MLKGERVMLRPLKRSDSEKTIHWRNNMEIIWQAMLNRFPKTIEMEEAWYNKVLSDISNKNIYFGIEEIETSEFIGIAQLTEIDWVSGTAFWGLIIGGENKQGKGYGTEAARLLFQYAFGMLNIRKISGYCIANNIGTIKMHDKLSKYYEEGRLKEHFYFDNKFNDVLVISFFKEDFKITNKS